MKRVIAIACALAVGLPAASPLMAQSAPPGGCQGNSSGQDCPPPKRGQNDQGQKGPGQGQQGQRPKGQDGQGQPPQGRPGNQKPGGQQSGNHQPGGKPPREQQGRPGDQGRGPDQGGPGHQGGPGQGGNRANNQPGGQPGGQPGRQGGAPHVGERARGGQPFHQAENSRLPRPPRGQEYRVINDHVVRIDSKTLEIIAVVGLLGALMQ